MCNDFESLVIEMHAIVLKFLLLMEINIKPSNRAQSYMLLDVNCCNVTTVVMSLQYTPGGMIARITSHCHNNC